MNIQTLRFNVQSLTKACNKESNPVLLKYYKRKHTIAQQALNNAKRFDSASKPCRTPWKRLIAPNKYFEDLG